MNRKVIYIRHRTKHHAENSGYSKLIDYVNCDYLPKETDPHYLPFKVRKFIAKNLVGKRGGIYNEESLRKEILLIRRMLKEKEGIAHFLNGERDIHFSTKFKRYNNWKIVASFHKPPDVLTRNISQYRYLRRIDGAIAVGANQVDYLKEKLKTDRVVFIPHGVDVNYFSPATGIQQYEPYTALFVGYHLRDIRTLVAASEIIKKKFPEFKLKIVMNDKHAHLFPPTETYQIFDKIPDSELRQLYQTSSVLLIPLKDSTACNSVLEGMACGLPTITTDTGGIRGYINERNGLLVKNKDSHSLAEATIHLMEQPDLNMKMRIQSREESYKFCWEEIGKRMIKQYENWFS